MFYMETSITEHLLILMSLYHPLTLYIAQDNYLYESNYVPAVDLLQRGPAIIASFSS